jgi:hypothetical protein
MYVAFKVASLLVQMLCLVPQEFSNVSISEGQIPADRSCLKGMIAYFSVSL